MGRFNVGIIAIVVLADHERGHELPLLWVVGCWHHCDRRLVDHEKHPNYSHWNVACWHLAFVVYHWKGYSSRHGFCRLNLCARVDSIWRKRTLKCMSCRVCFPPQPFDLLSTSFPSSLSEPTPFQFQNPFRIHSPHPFPETTPPYVFQNPHSPRDPTPTQFILYIFSICFLPQQWSRWFFYDNESSIC